MFLTKELKIVIETETDVKWKGYLEIKADILDAEPEVKIETKFII